MAEDGSKGFEEALEDLEKGAHKGAEIHSITDPYAGVEAPPHPDVDALRERFGDALYLHQVMAGDEHVVFFAPDRVTEALAWLKEEARYDLLQDLTCVDFGGGRPFQVLWQLWSTGRKRQLRVKTELPLDALEVETVVPLWSTANWLEREAYDMFGVTFDGHPDLRRILMPENYAEGHPLRKDFPLRGRFSRAEQTRRALAMEVEDFYVPAELDVMRRHGAASAGPGSGRQDRGAPPEAEAAAGTPEGAWRDEKAADATDAGEARRHAKGAAAAGPEAAEPMKRTDGPGAGAKPSSGDAAGQQEEEQT